MTYITKKNIPGRIIDIRDDINFNTYLVTGFKIEISMFELKIFLGFKIIAFLGLFPCIFAYNSRTVEYFQNLIFDMNKRQKKYQNHYSFFLKNKSYMV